ncbi:hypothetical protein BGZ95_011017 [Linnemannia exigua]|uniref:RNI-like protein n=1 Tax=Linnemannia exigua TaxID=604196 RepID=A0AAD4DB23_9FUNG|nr:hypothetical protein BGZ95_011017 [Linnemannia exigua]
MSTPHQRFRQGDRLELLAVRKDKTTGELYSRTTDIQRSFPTASLFRVNGVILNFLEDEDEQLYEPNRIAHYPDDIIDIVTASSLGNDNSINTRDHYLPAQLATGDSMALTLSRLSIQPSFTTSSDTLVQPFSSRAITMSSASSSTTALIQTAPATRPMAVLSSIASEISQIQSKLDRSTDDQSAHHIQLMQQLFQMIQQQNETIKQLAEAKEREERVLVELAEAKERDEEMYRMQRQTIDRLIITQQRIDAILVQNYELHEYPIPRLFVILPETYERWDPRNLLMERFRLYFLCECGEEECEMGNSNYNNNTHGSTSSQLSNASADRLFPVRNSIHLAKHDGYELSRPTDFFSRYGPYVLGVLRILRHCLAVATVAAPAVGIAESSVKDVMDGVKSMSESTREAVDVSINFLEHKLEDNKTADDLAGDDSKEQEDDTMFENLTALEGADLRRLDTFLRNTDRDKILGNLYRITTERGHVKWVCLEHYKEAYCHTTLASFVQSIEAAGGIYSHHYRAVTITLTSSTLAKDFFKRLVKQALTVNELNVSLGWKFGSSDLVTMVDMLNRSNVRTFHLDLKDVETGNAAIAALRPGKGRYHSLLSLLSNTKLRALSFSNLLHLGARTSDLSPNHRPSLLQCFHFLQKIVSEDNPRLTNILHHCPGLVDLRLGSNRDNNKLDPLLHRAICSLAGLQILHLYRLDYLGSSDDDSLNSGSVQLLKDVACTASTHIPIYIRKAIQDAAPGMEVLMLRDIVVGDRGLDLTATHMKQALLDSSKEQRRMTIHDHLTDGGSAFSKLSHLSVSTRLSDSAVHLLASVLPALDLVHFGAGRYTRELMKHIRVQSLKSLAISLMHQDDASSLIAALLLHNQNNKPNACQIESLMIECNYPISVDLQGLLSHFQLERLFLSIKDVTVVDTILKTLDFSRLETLSIFCKEYDWDTEDILAWRSIEFQECLKVEIGYSLYWEMRDVFVGGSAGGTRKPKGSHSKLGRDRVVLHVSDHEREYLRYLQAVLPRYTY